MKRYILVGFAFVLVFLAGHGTSDAAPPLLSFARLAGAIGAGGTAYESRGPATLAPLATYSRTRTRCGRS